MLSYCLKCRKNTENKNPKVVKTKNGRIMPLSRCAVRDSKKSRFIKEQEASGLLSSLGIKITLKNLIVSFYHVTYEFERESTLYSCLNAEELLARNRRHI